MTRRFLASCLGIILPLAEFRRVKEIEVPRETRRDSGPPVAS